MSGDASEVSRNRASHYQARQQYFKDWGDEFHRRQKDWQRIDQLEAENAKLKKLVKDMFYAVHPADREKFLTNVAELGVEVAE